MYHWDKVTARSIAKDLLGDVVRQNTTEGEGEKMKQRE
jgi:hypothetical protein